MSRGLLVFLAMCAFAIAMVPTDRPAANPDEQEESKEEITCNPTTPCAWSVYKPQNKMIDLNITNNYCRCPPDLVCTKAEDNRGASCYIFRCMKPGYNMDDNTDTTDSIDTTDSVDTTDNTDS